MTQTAQRQLKGRSPMLMRIWGKLKKTLACLAFTSKVKCDGKPTVYSGVTVLSTDVSAGKGLTVHQGAYIWGGGPIRIGDNVAIGKDTIIFAGREGGITIGNDVAIAAQCYIIDSDHGLKKNRLIREQTISSQPIAIEDDVWLGAGVKILKGVTLKRGCVCAAGAVVTHDVPEYAIVGGVPAKVIGWRK